MTTTETLLRGMAATAVILVTIGAARSSTAASAQAAEPSSTSPAVSAGAGAQPPAAAAPSIEAPPFPALESILADYRGLRVGSAYGATGHELRIGHLRVTFRSGTLYSILTRSGKEAGFIFEGEGRYSYTTEDPRDLQTIETNILANVNTSAYRDGTLSEDARGCVFVSTAPLLPDVLGASPSTEGAAPASAASHLSSFLSAMDEGDVGMDHAAALALLGGSPARIVYGEIDSPVVDPGYYFDPIVDREERLFVFRKIQGDRFGRMVSRQLLPEGNTRVPILLTHLDYSLDTNDNKNAEVTSIQTFTFDRPWGRLLRLDLLNHLEDYRSNWKSTTRTLDVKSVKTADGRDLPYSHRYNELCVELPDAPAAGSTLTLRFDLSLHYLARKDGDQYFFLQDWDMHPSLPWTWSTRATCRLAIRTKKPYRTIPLGGTASVSEEGGGVKVESIMDRPTRFPLVIAGKFDTKESQSAAVEARVHIYGGKFGRAADAYGKGALEGLETYGRMLGAPYPLKEINIIQFDWLGLYVSPAGLLILSNNPATAPSVVESRRDAVHARAFAHELAHQWFANMVMPETFPQDNWISESIAEYLGALVYSAGGKDPREQTQRLKLDLDDWWGSASMSKGSASIAQAAYLRGGLNENVYAAQLLYGKGPLVIHMLHTMLGTDRFMGLLKTVVAKYSGKTISTDEFAKETRPSQVRT